MDAHRIGRVSRGLGLAAALLAAGAAGLALALDAVAAAMQIDVSPLAIVSSGATGSVSGFAPGTPVTIDGVAYTADGNGTVALAASPLDEDSALGIAFTDAGGVPRTASAPLVHAVTGQTLTPAEIADPVPDATQPVQLAVEVADAPPATTSTGGGTTSTTPAPGGTVETPAPPVETTTPAAGGSEPGAVSRTALAIPVTSVRAPERLVVARVRFSPAAMSRTRRVVVARVVVRDTRGRLVRGARVTIRNRKLFAVKTAVTSRTGVAVLRLRGRPAAWRTSARLALVVRATRRGAPAVASKAKTVRLRVLAPR